MALLERSHDTIAPKLAKTYHETCSRQRPPAWAGGREAQGTTPRNRTQAPDRPTNGTASFLSATRQDHRNASLKVAEESSQYLKLLYGLPLKKKRHALKVTKPPQIPLYNQPSKSPGETQPPNSPWEIPWKVTDDAGASGPAPFQSSLKMIDRKRSSPFTRRLKGPF